MIGSAMPVLTKDLCVVQKVEFSMACYMCDTYTLRKAKCIHKGQPHLLVRMLHKDYYSKGSVEKRKGIFDRESQGT
jgi:hypothetical protein